MTLGTSSKVRQCLLTVFSLAHQHGNILREGWKNILDALVSLFRAKLLPDELVQVSFILVYTKWGFYCGALMGGVGNICVFCFALW